MDGWWMGRLHGAPLLATKETIIIHCGNVAWRVLSHKYHGDGGRLIWWYCVILSTGEPKNLSDDTAFLINMQRKRTKNAKVSIGNSRYTTERRLTCVRVRTTNTNGSQSVEPQVLMTTE